MFIVGVVAKVIDVTLDLIVWAIIAQVIASWLVAFGVLNTRNRAVYMIVDVLERSTAPILRPIRRVLPPFGGLDLSPLVVLLAISYVIRPILYRYFLIYYYQ
jgi:YggT family protein